METEGNLRASLGLHTGTIGPTLPKTFPRVSAGSPIAAVDTPGTTEGRQRTQESGAVAHACKRSSQEVEEGKTAACSMTAGV